MVFITAAQINHFDKQAGLRGYPKSEQWFIGIDLFLEQRFDVAAEAFHQGARVDSCVACMFYYAEVQRNHNNQASFHLALPWTLEGALRGHIHCMKLLVIVYYNQKKVPESQQMEAEALRNYWIQMMVEFSEERKIKEDVKSCSSCCKSKNKNSEDNKSNNNGTEKNDKRSDTPIIIGEEEEEKSTTAHHRQLSLLRHYNKPHDAIEIRKAILRGEDPKKLQTLQTVRTKLGLNRPEEHYQEVLVFLNNNNTTDTDTDTDNNNSQDNNNNNNHNNKNEKQRSANRFDYLMGRKDGTVHIGSTPELI